MKFNDYDTGEPFETRINNLGYRGADISLTKKPGGKRILMLGDSFILGFGVKDDKLVTSRLQSKLESASGLFTNAQVVNAGYSGGFGPDGYFLHLKNYGVKLEPDLVIFSVFVYNDFSDMADSEWIGTGEFGEPVRVVSKTTQVDDFGHLIPRSIPFIYNVPILRESNLAILSAKGFEQLLAFGKHYTDRIKYKIFPPTFPTADATDSNLAGEYMSNCLFGDSCHRSTMHLYSDLLSVIKASRKLAPRFVVLLIPVDFQIYPDSLAKYKDQGLSEDKVLAADPNPQKRIKQMLDEEGIPYIDLLGPMRANTDRLVFKIDGHWNVKGHEVAAEEIYRFIAANYR